MRAGVVVAAALLGSASASVHARHAHLNRRHGGKESSYSAPPAPTKPSLPDHRKKCDEIVTVTILHPMSPLPVPTPVLAMYHKPGTYKLPVGPSISIEKDTVVAAPTTKLITPGHNVYGGVVTSCAAAQTINVPYAEESAGVYALKSTSYVCPSAGEYTIIPPSTVAAEASTVMVYPIPASYAAGMYTQGDMTVTAHMDGEIFAVPYELATTLTVTVTNQVQATATVVATKGQEPAPQQKGPVDKYVAPPSDVIPQTPPSSAPITNGKKWAMTYTPYATDGQCKSAGDVMIDVGLIKGKGFTTLRIYGTDCDGLNTVGAAAAAHGLKLIIGVFIKETGIDGARPQIGDIINWGSAGNFGMVIMVVVGNECLHQGHCEAGALAGFIGEMKSALQGAGAGQIQVTTTETVDAFLAHKDVLCPVIDVAAANIQSYFDGKVEASQAGSFVASQLQMISDACPGKPAYNLESGWPSGGSNNGASIASPEAQAAAIADIIDKAGDKTVVFSFQDDNWKHPGPLGIEPHFGCLQHV